ncbi:ADP-ribosylation factor-like protein 16 [Histomonas meleagridis]|uniref:ADP-ribosylation factor-like protein 16 n=1 Tax=Histomonas meleagridis TaxID=135588 RepID=UPI00355AAD3D|nr:ADP-ribosylation factor-like protein 16 [Histomonas meleagridis]KAH0802711.1 ADP-ribosylation factor-like protein 16 [Histomonas meleagridis]
MLELLNKKKLTPFDPIPTTTPTEGISTSNLKLKGKPLSLQELGGASIKEWKSHSIDSKAIVYVFDSADYTKTAYNVVYLNRLLNDEDLKEKQVLVALSKCDIPESLTFNTIDEIIGFENLLNTERIKFLETSSVNGIGLTDIFRWISEIFQ